MRPNVVGSIRLTVRDKQPSFAHLQAMIRFDVITTVTIQI